MRQLDLFGSPAMETPDLDLELKRLGLAPHPYGVGKKMPLEQYVHRSAEDSLPQDLLAAARGILPSARSAGASRQIRDSGVRLLLI